MDNYNYDNVLKIITVLAQHNHNILEIEINGKVKFFLAKTFEKSSSGTIQNTPFFAIQGKDITDFLANHPVNPTPQILLERLRTMDEGLKNIRFEFSNDHTWRFYTSDY